MNGITGSKTTHFLIVASCLVAAADFLTTWWALSCNSLARETGIMASHVLKLGGFPVLLGADIMCVGMLVGLAYAVHVRYRTNLAALLLLGPYICVGIYSAVNNAVIAL
jgi:hypothetical protein